MVELIGPAGSGKSTVARRLGLRSEVEVVSDVRAVPMASRCGAAIGAVPRAVHLALVGGGARPFGWTARVDAYRGLRPTRPVMVLDQGPAYTLARLLAARPTAADDGWFVRRAEVWGRRLHTLVMLDAPDEVLVRRIRERSKDHAVRHLSGDDAAAAVRWQRSELERIAVVLEREGVEVVEVSTADGPIERIVDAVAATWTSSSAARN